MYSRWTTTCQRKAQKSDGFEWHRHGRLLSIIESDIWTNLLKRSQYYWTSGWSASRLLRRCLRMKENKERWPTVYPSMILIHQRLVRGIHCRITGRISALTQKMPGRFGLCWIPTVQNGLERIWKCENKHRWVRRGKETIRVARRKVFRMVGLKCPRSLSDVANVFPSFRWVRYIALRCLASSFAVLVVSGIRKKCRACTAAPRMSWIQKNPLPWNTVLNESCNNRINYWSSNRRELDEKYGHIAIHIARICLPLSPRSQNRPQMIDHQEGGQR